MAHIKQSNAEDSGVSSTRGFEVFNTHDSVNAWVPCEIVDIIASQNQGNQFKVRLTSNFTKQYAKFVSLQLFRREAYLTVERQELRKAVNAPSGNL